jgi:hypothetical protein
MKEKKSKKEKSKRGGKRTGSGQKLKYNEDSKTVAFRCPISKVEKLKEIVNVQLSEWVVLK